MNKLSNIIQENRIYVIMIAFIVLINLLALAGSMIEERAGVSVTNSKGISNGAGSIQGEESVPTTPDSGLRTPNLDEDESATSEEDKMKLRQERLEKLSQENPLLYIFIGLFNLLILFAIFIGIILDIYFLMRWIRKDPIGIKITEPGSPLWGIADVIRVAIIFLTCGYLIVIFQGYLEKIFPIFRNENFNLIFSTAVMNVIGIGVILYFIVRKYGQNIKALGLTMKGVVSSIFYAVVGYIFIVPVLIGVMLLTFFIAKLIGYEPPVQPIVQVFMEEKTTSVLWLSVLFAAIFGPIAEEIFFRGFMYSAIKKKFGIFGAMLITSALFSLLHTHIVGFFSIMVLGMLLAYLYEKTGSLVSSITVHIIHNVGMVFMVFLLRSIGG
ncbi:MAG: CPBP family intramembrane metalloprotease [Candidatus Omnitrophica bacterium]|nr:CPBP family intramembrane metalloprotease [Candidatus Omnitrophota bacterium]